MRAEQTAALPIVPVRHGLAMRLVRMASSMMRIRIKRHPTHRLDELTDRERVDIGLTREDISRAFDGHVFYDPTQYLAQTLRARAREENVVHRQP